MCTHLDKTGSTYYFRRTVPDDLAGHFTTATGKPRTEWKFSLRTKDREEAKRLLRPYVTDTDKLIDDARAALGSAHTFSPEELAAQRQAAEEAAARANLEAESAARREARSELRTRWRQRRMTSTAMLTPEEAAAVDLIKERDAEVEALRQAIAVLETGNAKLGIQPKTQSLAAHRATPKPRLTLTGMFEDYAQSGAATPHTVKKWRAAIQAFIAHLGHDDASAVSRSDVSGWLKALVASGLSTRTVRGTYRAAVARIFKLAYGDGLLATNVAAALEVRGPKATKTARDDISDNEARIILEAALAPPADNISSHHALARRWAPWICAYTGARIAEVTQLRACDIRQEDGIWVFWITPEAGSVKNGAFRVVPVHSHLIEQGILRLAKANDETPLFYNPAASRKADAVQRQPQQLGTKLAKWVRELGVTEVASPNHGWRHRFKTVARTVGIPMDARDVMQGHAPRSQGDG